MGVDYYDKKYIAYLLIESTKDRDVSALSKGNANIRALSVKCLYDLERALKVIGWEKHKQNLYVSCARLKEIPSFTFSPTKRSGETGDWFKNEYEKLVSSYDLLFDFDKKPEDSWEELVKEVKVLKDYLDEYEVPYYILFSGGKGFQIVIDGKYLEIEEINQSVFPHKTIVEKIKEALDLTFLDLSNNGVPSRLRKLPYSLIGENVALPLSDAQFNNFKIDDMKIKNVLTKVRPLMRRGILERNGTKEGLKTFIKMFEF